MKLKINEIFQSIQGEGGRSGILTIFIRLAGCDLACGFCDTEFESGKEMTVDELKNYLSNYEAKSITWTGGEPALQLTEEIVDYFHSQGYYQAIETNGNNKVPHNLDYICVSPKVAEHVVKKNFGESGIDELRYVRHKGQIALPEPKIESKHYFLSPMFNGNEIDKENLNHCINLLKKDEKWRLSIQLHKLIKIL